MQTSSLKIYKSEFQRVGFDTAELSQKSAGIVDLNQINDNYERTGWIGFYCFV
jgi:hypothetical protein